MKSQQQVRATARRKGWLGIAAATAMLATSMGGTMLAFAADDPQSDIHSDAVLTPVQTDEVTTPETETAPNVEPTDPNSDNSGTNQQPIESPGDTGESESQDNSGASTPQVEGTNDTEGSSSSPKEAAAETSSGRVAPAPLAAPTGYTTLKINSGGARAGSTDTINGVEGLTFYAIGGYDNSVRSYDETSEYSCTTDESGTCEIVVPDRTGYTGLISRSYDGYWITTGPSDTSGKWQRINQVANGGSNTTATTARNYVFHTGNVSGVNSVKQVTAGTTATGGSAHLDNFMVRKTNPDFPEKCGLSVAMVFDTSGSMNGTDMTNMKNAAKLLVGNQGLGGTPTTVEMYRFSTNAQRMPGTYSLAQPDGVTAATSAINGLPSSGNGGTNWDGALRLVAEEGGYDIVLFLTDGDPTYRVGGGSGTTTTTADVEAAVASANLVKQGTGPQGDPTKVVSVGIGLSGGSVYNLQAISGPIQNDDYFLAANSAQLADQLQKLIQNCAGTISVVKQIVDEDGVVVDETPAGWTFNAASDPDGHVTPPSATTDDETGGVNFKVDFDRPGAQVPVTITEEQKEGYELVQQDGKNATCTAKGQTVDVVNEGQFGFKITSTDDSSISCKVQNKELKAGTLLIDKEFEGVPDGYGEDITFSGRYSCELPVETVVAEGSWSVDGSGSALLNADAGTPAANELPPGAVCTATEGDLPTGATGLPNTSWKWGAPIVTPEGGVTIERDGESRIVVTNTAERVYGDFSVEKIVPEGSVVDSEMTFGGNWTCTLGDETVTGTWGPIAPGPDSKWTSTDEDEIPLGAKCSATEEERPDTPVSNGSYEWDGDPVVSGAVTAAGTGEQVPVITVTNETKEVPGSVSWLKVDGNGKALAGSVWKITPIDPSGEAFEIEDCVANTATECTGYDKDPAAGAFRVEDLPWGDYKLEEIKAPAGYVLITGEYEFTIDADNRNVVIDEAFVNTQQEVPGLPITGGRAAVVFTAAGLLILGGAGGAALITRRRKIS